MIKRGQGLSLTVIVIAALVLIVLIIIISIFVQKISSSSKLVTDCESKGGFCARTCSQEYVKSLLDCPNEISACCLKYQETAKSTIIVGDLFP